MSLDTKTKYPYLHSGELYIANDSKLMREQRECLKTMKLFNLCDVDDFEHRATLLKEMCWQVGENCFIEGRMIMNFGGNHLILGNNVYINHDFCAVDDTFITIGDFTMIGPRVTIATAQHPEDPELRAKGYQFNKPVFIGKNVWIGANVVICPGVTIGDGSIIGAGAVVNKDIPENVIAVGVPCHVLRPLRPEDRSNLNMY